MFDAGPDFSTQPAARADVIVLEDDQAANSASVGSKFMDPPCNEAKDFTEFVKAFTSSTGTTKAATKGA